MTTQMAEEPSTSLVTKNKSLDELSPRARIIATHMIGQVANVHVGEQPYQHFSMEHCFPEDIYEEMKRRLPPRDSYLPLNIKRWKNADGDSTRDRLNLSEGEMERVPAEDRAFWIDVTEALMCREVQQSFYEVLKQDVALRLNCQPDEVLHKPVWPTVMLVRDFAEYRLKPHPDGHPRVVTAMFYLADEGDPEDLGTSVYRRGTALERLAGKKFVEVYRFPFLPNSAATFAVNETKQRSSLHGRELISHSDVVRDSLIVAWLSENQEDFGSKHNY